MCLENSIGTLIIRNDAHRRKFILQIKREWVFCMEMRVFSSRMSSIRNEQLFLFWQNITLSVNFKIVELPTCVSYVCVRSLHDRIGLCESH